MVDKCERRDPEVLPSAMLFPCSKLKYIFFINAFSLQQVILDSNLRTIESTWAFRSVVVSLALHGVFNTQIYVARGRGFNPHSVHQFLPFSRSFEDVSMSGRPDNRCWSCGCGV